MSGVNDLNTNPISPETPEVDDLAQGPTSGVIDLNATPASPDAGDPAGRPMPWEHWSRERRQWTALGVAGGLLLLGAVVGLFSFWS